MKPFLKWAGNKFQIVEQIRKILPMGKRLIEPFVGSGAVLGPRLWVCKFSAISVEMETTETRRGKCWHFSDRTVIGQANKVSWAEKFGQRNGLK